MPRFTVAEIAEFINAKIQGDSACMIMNLAPIDTAKQDEITFIFDNQYIQHITKTEASAIVTAPELLVHVEESLSSNSKSCTIQAILLVSNPKLSLAQLIPLFHPQKKYEPCIHSSAIIGVDCHIGENVSIGPHCVIQNRVTIGKNTIIEAGSMIGDDVILGEDCHLYPKTILYDQVQLGNNVILHSGVVLGADGFGFVMDQGKWVKIPQAGRVIIGNHVEIGANTTIDRGTLANTSIADGVKIDNQVQIGHNVQIGKNTIIAGCTGIAGSTQIGSFCMIGGGACIGDHLQIVDHVIIGGMGAVGQSIMEPGIYSSGIAISKNKEWRRNMLRFHQLDQIFKRVRKLELEYERNEH